MRRLLFLCPLGFCLSLGAMDATVSAQPYEQRFNCGTGAYTTQSGILFEADRPYVSGNAGYIGGFGSAQSWQPVGGTPDPILYEWNRFTHTEYRFDLPNGHYLVTLHLADWFEHSTGENVLDVVIEGVEVFDSIDVYERVGRTYAIDFVTPVEVTDGQLNVEFVPVLGIAVTGAISVVARNPDIVEPAAPVDVEALDSYGSVMLRWTAGDEDDLAGYQVERGQAATGPFTPVVVAGGDSIERVPWRVDAALPGETWYYRVRAVDAYGNLSAPSDVVSGTSLAHDASTLPLVEILIDAAHLEILNDNPTSDTEVPCSIVFDDAITLANSTCRYRGNVARSLFKKSWKVKVQIGSYEGRDNFNLNAEYIDKSLLRESISYEVLARAGAMTPMTRHLHMIVNDDWTGVYLDVENVNRDFLDRVGLESGLATMYKVGDNLKVLPTVQDYMDAYEKELGDPADYSDLITFIEELNSTPPELMFNWLASHIDFNRFFDFYSTEVILQNPDINLKNFYLHHDLETDLWTPIPWDVDLTFGITYPFVESTTAQLSIYLGSGNRLFVKVFTNPMWKQLHFDRIRQLFASVFEPVAMAAMIDSVYGEIAYDAERDWWKWGWTESAEFHAGPAALQQFVTDRTAYLEAQIANQEQPSALVINEVAASNGTIIADEFGEYDDWVEILNRGTAPVSLAGLYLTDDLALPGRMALPDTTLMPGEFALVWCDGDSLQGPWHAPFKLDVKGEAVGLFSGPNHTDAPIDVRPYDPQYTDATLGRLPDGSPYWQILATPTPGAPNVGGGNIKPQFRDLQHFPPSPGAGSPVVVSAHIFDDGSITGAELFYDAGSGFVSVPMLDDGLSGDGEAGDDVYGAEIPGQPPGQVLYYLRAEDDLGQGAFDPPRAPLSTHSYDVGYVAPEVYLNEYMAANDTTITDEWGDYDDWVEIFNVTGDTLELGGLHLTDDFSNPTRFELPAVSVPPGGFILIWCDGEPFEGPLHAPFKLDAAGEEIGLFDTVALGVGLIDTTSFGPQLPDVSIGRMPNGGPWQVMSLATPGTTNTPGVGIAGQAAAPRVLRLGGPYPNPFRPSTRLRLDLPAPAAVKMVVYDVQGRLVRTLIDRRLGSGSHPIEWDGRDGNGATVPSGVYWIHLSTPAGSRTARAVMLR